jgi:hypothetical protein
MHNRNDLQRLTDYMLLYLFYIYWTIKCKILIEFIVKGMNSKSTIQSNEIQTSFLPCYKFLNQIRVYLGLP